jgi:glucose-6-phosphate dehydrogenase assembly protein OpcA
VSASGEGAGTTGSVPAQPLRSATVIGIASGPGEDYWAEQNTTPDAIEAALRRLLRQRHAANRALAPARVLNLVVVVDRSWKGEIANRLDRVGRYHASRTVLCAVEERRTTLDAVAVMSYDNPDSPGVGVMREKVEIDMGPEHLLRLDTIVDPVIVAELSTMLWCPHGHDEAISALRGIFDVMLLDSDDAPEATAGLDQAADLLRSAYVVDLAWLRTTPWRERLAAGFDPRDRMSVLDRLDRLIIRHRPTSAASALLLAGWLASRLGWEARGLSSVDGAGLRGSLEVPVRGAEVMVELEPVQQDAPGLAGVTVGWGDGCLLSLDRGRGGLQAREHSADGRERTWQVLGASRGEGGILGEGVRQALLRDQTYAPALAAARSFCS